MPLSTSSSSPPPPDLDVYVGAPNMSVVVTTAKDKVSLTYRDVGPRQGVPIVLLNHWGATLDYFDPRIVATLARTHRVVATDYRGIGTSAGRVRTTVADMTSDFLALLDSLHIRRAHIVGFSLGGIVAQDVAMRAPGRVASLTLAGTGPAGGHQVGGWRLLVWFMLIFKSIVLLQDPRRYLFFDPTAQGKQHASAFLGRTGARKKDLDGAMSLLSMVFQAIAISRWGRQPKQNLGAKLTMPVLIVNGDKDRMIPTVNSKHMATQLPHATLVLYPHSGHGGLFQYADDFCAKVIETVSSSKESSL